MKREIDPKSWLGWVLFFILSYLGLSLFYYLKYPLVRVLLGFVLLAIAVRALALRKRARRRFQELEARIEQRQRTLEAGPLLLNCDMDLSQAPQLAHIKQSEVVLALGERVLEIRDASLGRVLYFCDWDQVRSCSTTQEGVRVVFDDGVITFSKPIPGVGAGNMQTLEFTHQLVQMLESKTKPSR